MKVRKKNCVHKNSKVVLSHHSWTPPEEFCLHKMRRRTPNASFELERSFIISVSNLQCDHKRFLPL